MTDALHAPPTSHRLPHAPPQLPDTTAGSVLHLLPGVFERLKIHAFTPEALYLLAVLFTYVPLFLFAWHDLPSIVAVDKPLLLPFLYDGSVMFTFLVSFPCMLILTVTDQKVLAHALHSVWADGTITMSDSEWALLGKDWRRRFRGINVGAQAFGLVLGVVIARYNFKAFTPVDVGHWIARGGHLLPLGGDYLFCIFLFYVVLPVYVIRNLAMALLLRDIAAKAQLNILPLHPDHAGGLLPIGRLGLRNQYALSLFGLNIILLLITYSVLGHNSLLVGLNVLATLAYLLLGPFVFIAPLMPFRDGMLKAKARVMADVGLWLRSELKKLNERLESGQITKDDEELIERARKIGALAEDVPVWPFDAATVRRFLAAYAIPLAGSISLLALKAAASLFHITLPG